MGCSKSIFFTMYIGICTGTKLRYLEGNRRWIMLACPYHPIVKGLDTDLSCNYEKQCHVFVELLHTYTIADMTLYELFFMRDFFFTGTFISCV